MLFYGGYDDLLDALEVIAHEGLGTIKLSVCHRGHDRPVGPVCVAPLTLDDSVEPRLNRLNLANRPLDPLGEYGVACERGELPVEVCGQSKRPLPEKATGRGPTTVSLNPCPKIATQALWDAVTIGPNMVGEVGGPDRGRSLEGGEQYQCAAGCSRNLEAARGRCRSAVIGRELACPATAASVCGE